MILTIYSAYLLILTGHEIAISLEDYDIKYYVYSDVLWFNVLLVITLLIVFAVILISLMNGIYYFISAIIVSLKQIYGCLPNVRYVANGMNCWFLNATNTV